MKLEHSEPEAMTTSAPQQLGEPVDFSSSPLPRRVTFEGRTIRLVPLDALEHLNSLWANTSGPQNEHLWTHMFEDPFQNRASFEAYLQRKEDSDDPLYYSIVDKATGDAVGWAAYMRMDPLQRVIEVGSIMFSPRLQRTVGGTEAMYLMAKHAFEDMNYRRYEWKCDALNMPSRRAALRLGFTYEGLFRQHMIVKRRNRDTAWYSMLDWEWPARKRALEQWLDPANFDPSGKQRISLAELNHVKL
jgi:RimJ/RimL family protein N-acetyltransferase